MQKKFGIVFGGYCDEFQGSNVDEGRKEIFLFNGTLSTFYLARDY